MIGDLLARADRLSTALFGRLDRDGADRLAFVLFILAHLAVWTLYASLSQANLSSNVDMFENWAWGREFRLGYHKHPPLFAWVTGVWFEIFPRADWAYFLLSATVGAVGLAGVYASLGTVERGPRRLVAVAALELSPIWGFLAIKFNANTILLALWPWAIWAFLRALDKPTVLRGIAVGAMLALAMLGKYMSLTLILAMLAALALPAERRALLRSPTMAAAVVAGLVVLAPHLVWLVANDFETIRYADDQTASSTAHFFLYLARFPLAQALYVLPVAIGVAVAAGPALAGTRPWRGFFAWRAATPARRSLLILGLGPFVATVLLAVATFSELSSPWGFPLWSLVGALLVTAPGLAAVDLRPSRLFGLLAVFFALVLVAAPVVDVVSTLAGARVAVAPARPLAAAAEAAWLEASGGKRLAIVGGDQYYAGAVTFYAADRPSEFIDFDRRHAPWITPERLDREGALTVCLAADERCRAAARAALGDGLIERDVTVATRRWWWSAAPVAFHLAMRLPRAGG